MKLEEWQAILAAYGILLIISETSAAPLASLAAWGVAITYLLDVAANKGTLISNLFAAPTLAQTPPSQVSGSGAGSGIAPPRVPTIAP